MIHDFIERRDWSVSLVCDQFWRRVYSLAFDGYIDTSPPNADARTQRLGLDRVVLISGGGVVRIDEKTRSRDYGDILIEYVSNDRTGAPGWIEQDLQVDYLAYGVPGAGIAFLIAWMAIRRAWIANRDQWLAAARSGRLGFRTVMARNEGYTTISVAVPQRRLWSVLGADEVIRVRLADASRLTEQAGACIISSHSEATAEGRVRAGPASQHEGGVRW